MTDVRLYVKAPPGSAYTTPKALKRVDDQLVIFGALMKSPPPEGMPVQEPDGTWEIRVLDPSAVNIVKRVLTQDYGLEIVREQTVE